MLALVVHHRGFEFDPPLPVPSYNFTDTIGSVVVKSHFLKQDEEYIAVQLDSLTQAIFDRHSKVIDDLAHDHAEQLSAIQDFIPEGFTVQRPLQ